MKDRINKRGKYELIIDHRIRKRFPQHHISRQRIPRGKYSKQKKEEYKRKEERIKVAILRFAASRGISRYRCLMNGAVWPVIELPSLKRPYDPEEDRKLLEFCFDDLALSIPPILETFYNPELGEDCLKIKDPLLGEFIISADQLLGHLINRMELESTYGTKKKPTKDEVDWIDFFYPKERSNIIFTYFYEIQKQRVKVEHVDNEYEYKRKYYDSLIRQTWNDIQTKYNYVKLNYPEIFHLMLNKVYPESMRNQ